MSGFTSAWFEPQVLAAVGPVWVEVQTISGRAAAVELRVMRDFLEVWHHNQLAGSIDREVLAGWMADPSVPELSNGEVTLGIDRLVDVDGRLSITLPDVDAWALSPTEQQSLERRLGD